VTCLVARRSQVDSLLGQIGEVTLLESFNNPRGFEIGCVRRFSINTSKDFRMQPRQNIAADSSNEKLEVVIGVFGTDSTASRAGPAR
jgi:hypothetical protein